MIEPVEFTSPKIVGYRVQGYITTADIKPWAELLDAKIKQEGMLRLYVEYEEVTGLTMSAVMEDLKFDITHFNDFEKAAVVSNKNWVNLASYAANILPNLEVKTFTFVEKEQAMQWVQQ